MSTEEDTVIVSLLREDSRMSLTEMSKVSKIPISTLYGKLKLYKNGLILKHTALVDFSQLGYRTRARVLFKVKKEDMHSFREHLLSSHVTNELYKVTNGYDYMAEFIFATMKELEDYLDLLETKFHVQKEQVFYLVDELQREGFLSRGRSLLFGMKK